MKKYNSLIIDNQENGTVHIYLNRPEKRNALSGDMLLELTDFVSTIRDSSIVRAIIISGMGKVFSAGGDIAWMKEQMEADRAARISEAKLLAETLRLLNEIPQPLIAKVHGGVYGAAIGLLCVCDVIIAEKGTKFGLTATKLGLTPGPISPYIVARIGEGMARRFFMSSRIFDAQEAIQLGLISQAVSTKDLDKTVSEQVIPFLSVAPKATGAAKLLVRNLGRKIDQRIIDITVSHLADMWETEEAKKGISAFLNKQPIDWNKEYGSFE